jgi:hypothetical protein
MTECDDATPPKPVARCRRTFIRGWYCPAQTSFYFWPRQAVFHQLCEAARTLWVHPSGWLQMA